MKLEKSTDSITPQTHEKFLKEYFKNSNPDELLQIFVNHLMEDHYFNEKDIHKLIQKTKEENDSLIPISIFQNEKLSVLETITKYLKEVKQYKFSQIARLLNRNDRTIWVTYNNTKKKMPELFEYKPSSTFVPANIFHNRLLSMLENITVYLKEKHGLKFSQIAKLLNRNDRTIWTVYNRAQKKRNSN